MISKVQIHLFLCIVLDKQFVEIVLQYRVSQKNLCTLQDAIYGNLEGLKLLAGRHFLTAFSSRIQEPLTFCHLNKHAQHVMLGVIDPLVTIQCLPKCPFYLLSMVTLRVYNFQHVHSNDKSSMVPESLIKMLRENASLLGVIDHQSYHIQRLAECTSFFGTPCIQYLCIFLFSLM